MADIIAFKPRKRDATALPAGHVAQIVILPVVAVKPARPIDIIGEMRRMGLAQ